MIKTIKLNWDWNLNFGAIKSNIKQLMELNLIEEINSVDLNEYYNFDYLEFLDFINDNLKNYKNKEWKQFDLTLEY